MQWINFDKTESYKKLQEIAKAPVDVKTAMAGEGGAERVAKYKVPMSNGLVYSYAAKQVDDTLLDALQGFADEAQLTDMRTREISIWSSRREPANSRRKSTRARSSMKTARNIRQRSRSVSADPTSAPAPCILLWRTGQR